MRAEENASSTLRNIFPGSEGYGIKEDEDSNYNKEESLLFEGTIEVKNLIKDLQKMEQKKNETEIETQQET